MVDNHLLHKGNKILIVCQVKENRKVINQQQSISKKLFFLYIRDRETPKIDTKRIVPLFLMSSCYTFSSYCRSCYDHRIFAKSNSLLFFRKVLRVQPDNTSRRINATYDFKYICNFFICIHS